ncbi:MAG: hemerythrin domain-containing protein [Deltaproteobacteria bacterium]|nr:hemerythrin domain-containing protein [Deltaproteobacteria bacterium]
MQRRSPRPLCPEMTRLSEEHRSGILAAHRLRLGLAGSDARAEALTAFLRTWKEVLLPHLRREEEVLLPELAQCVSEGDALIVLTLSDHTVLRRLVRELRRCPHDARPVVALRIGQRLREHVAFEERTLFPAVEQALGRKTLKALSRELAEEG